MAGRGTVLRGARLLLVAVLLAVPACSSDPDDAAGDQPTLSAVASYGRHAAVRGKADVLVSNSGDEPLRVLSWQIRHPLFERVPPSARESVVSADGVARIVPVPFGRPQCDRSDDDGAAVVLRVRDPDGAERDVVVPLADREPGLARAHRLACAAQRVTEAAVLDLVAPFERLVEDGRPALRTRLSLMRRGSGAVSVDLDSLTGNILFTVDTAAGVPLVLADDESSARTDVLIAATRCEAHALTESKTSFTFALFASVDGAEPAQVQMTVGNEARAALQSLLSDTCELPSPS